VIAWLIQYEWLLFFGLILALAIADLVVTRRALRRSRKQEVGKHESTGTRD
jgi:membrane protein implicated in regulation of membrane protease activity